MLVMPSPKDHIQLSIGGPDEISENVTVRGGVPHKGEASKAATRGPGVTVTAFVCVNVVLPVGPVTASVTV